MNKKIISLVLALVMVLGTFTSVFAEAAKADAKKTDETKKTEVKKAEAGEKVEKVVGKDNKIQYVVDKKLVEGYEDGNLGLDKNIKRSEITRLLVLANGNEELSKQLQGSMKIYSDVDAKHWANGVISVGTTVPSDANGIAMLAGYPDGSFKPENDVTYAELAKMLVVLAKKDLTADMVKNAKWATSWMTWAAQLGILDDVNVVDSNKAANRADAFTMVYNALYVMKEFKRVPANETRGIISNFTKDTLTLNQDSKMEYKVTGETVVVKGQNAKRQQVAPLSGLDWKVEEQYFLGSLVRILTNDKNEVTHIIELGNPSELARANDAGYAVANDIWRGVADNTIETANKTNKRNAKEAQEALLAGESYATIEFNKNNIDAKKVVFHNVKNAVRKDKTVSLKINKDTEFYVANPANNVMKKVANVNEALALIGFHDYNNYKLVGVYAGFNTDGIDRNYGAIQIDTEDRHTAKVVVFNFVNKAAEGEKFRVIESSSSKFMTTLEKTDGTLLDRNNVYDTARFPLEYGDKLDVIELDDYRTGSIYTTLIDHSDTKVFPIVRITDVREDGKVIYVEDKDGTKSMLDLRDADIFSAKRYGKLEAGNTIQFRVSEFQEANVTNKNYKQAANNTAEIISLLGKEMPLKGSLVNVIPSADKTLEVGRIVSVQGIDTDYPTVTLRVDYNIFDAADSNGYATYNVANEVAKAAKEFSIAHPDRKVDFKVFEKVFNGNHYAADFKDTLTGAVLVNTVEKTNFELLVEKVKKADRDFRIIDAKNITAARQLQDEINSLFKTNGTLDIAKWNADDNENYRKANQAFNKRIEDAEKTIQDLLLTEVKKVVDTKVTIDDKETLNDEAKVNTAIKAAIKSLVDLSKYNVVVSDVDASQKITDANREAGIKVVVSTKDGVHEASKNILVTVAIKGE